MFIISESNCSSARSYKLYGDLYEQQFTYSNELLGKENNAIVTVAN